MKKNKAFTIIEMLTVLVIIGILATLIVPQVTKYVEKSKKTSYLTTLTSFGKYIELSHPKELNEENAVNIYSFEEINMEKGDNKESPYGSFVKDRSFIVVLCADKCKTYVQAVDDESKGVKLTSLDELTSKDIVTINGEDTMFPKCDKDAIKGFLNKAGDIDRDGKITNMDVQKLQSILMEDTPINNDILVYSDVNLNGKIDHGDVTLIRKYLVHKINVLPLRYGDSTADCHVNIFDASEIQKHLNAYIKLTGNNLESSDVNLDEQITTDDVTLIQNALRKEITALPIVYGDPNNDGKITTKDIETIEDHIKKKIILTGNELESADVNLDNAITVSDIQLIEKYINGEVNTLPYKE